MKKILLINVLIKIIKTNILQTRAEFFEYLVTNINFNGNNYAAINYDRGYIKELIPMNPLLMTPEIKNNKVVYTYNHEDNDEILDAGSVPVSEREINISSRSDFPL